MASLSRCIFKNLCYAADFYGSRECINFEINKDDYDSRTILYDRTSFPKDKEIFGLSQSSYLFLISLPACTIIY